MAFAPDAPGFRHVLIAPHPVDGLTWANATVPSLYGDIASHWERGPGLFRLQVRLPANTTAAITLPADDVEAVTENGRPLGDTPGVTAFRCEGGQVIVEAGSGSYDFRVTEGGPDAST